MPGGGVIIIKSIMARIKLAWLWIKSKFHGK